MMIAELDNYVAVLTKPHPHDLEYGRAALPYIYSSTLCIAAQPALSFALGFLDLIQPHVIPFNYHGDVWRS